MYFPGLYITYSIIYKTSTTSLAEIKQWQTRIVNVRTVTMVPFAIGYFNVLNIIRVVHMKTSLCDSETKALKSVETFLQDFLVILKRPL